MEREDGRERILSTSFKFGNDARILPKQTKKTLAVQSRINYTTHMKDQARHRARVMINRAVKDLTGGAVELSDLADTFNLCAGTDELEEMIKQADDSTPIRYLLDTAYSVALQLLEEEGFPV
jgi:hypothetical protein